MPSNYLSSRFLLVIWICIAISFPVIGKAERAQAIQQRDIAGDVLRSWGYHVSPNPKTELLKVRRAHKFPVDFKAGLVYKLVVSGCADAFDLDLFILNSRGELILKDIKDSKIAEAHFIPPYSGKYYIVIAMAKCTPDGAAHYTFVYGFKNVSELRKSAPDAPAPSEPKTRGSTI